MTKQEQRAIRRAIETHREISLGGVEYTYGAGADRYVRTELMSPAEVDRLFASEDFRLGWKMAHQRLSEMIEWIMSASNPDLIKYAGRARGKQ